MMGIAAAITAVAAVAGAGVATYGAIQQTQAARQQANYQRQALEEQKKAEALRRRQMELDASRRRRQAVREQVQAAAYSTATTTAAGAGSGESSALPGAMGSISGAAGNTLLGVNQSEEIGQGIFQANQNMLTAYQGEASARAAGALGSGLSSFGGALMTNAGKIGQIGSFMSNGFGKGFSLIAYGPSGYGR